MNEWQLRREIVEFGKKAYDKNFVTATDGNISARLMGDRLLITPSGSCLGELNPGDLIYINLNGNILNGASKPTTELPMHITAYHERPDINAVIHAHPPVTTGFSVAGESLARCVIPEVVLTFGKIPTTEYATPSSPEGAKVIKSLIKNHDALILDRHGTLTVGKNLSDAFRKLEKVEYCAKVTLTAKQLGKIRQLSRDELKSLENLRSKIIDENGISLCEQCGICR